MKFVKVEEIMANVELALTDAGVSNCPAECPGCELCDCVTEIRTQLADGTDVSDEHAESAWNRIAEENSWLVTSDPVRRAERLVALALVQHRLHNWDWLEPANIASSATEILLVAFGPVDEFDYRIYKMSWWKREERPVVAETPIARSLALVAAWQEHVEYRSWQPSPKEGYGEEDFAETDPDPLYPLEWFSQALAGRTTPSPSTEA